MVGSVSDPVITELIATANDSAFWTGAGSDQDGSDGPQPPAATVSRSHEHTAGEQLTKGVAADKLHVSDENSSTGGFQFAGLTKPPSLTMQKH